MPLSSGGGGDDNNGFLPHGATSTLGGAQNWEPLDFDEMFGRLVVYVGVNSHPDVPVKFPDDPS